MTLTEKREYLIKTLSRTKRKDYENYVIGAIWHRLNNLEIKPVSQQYVKRSDDKYALLDLYFPQINVGIECDEAYHERNTEPDKIRETNVEQALSALQTGKDFNIIRINANTDIIEFENQINRAVEQINDLYRKYGSPKWTDEKDAVAKAIDCGELSLYDNLQFSKIIDIAKCFGKNYKAMQSSTFFIDKNTLVWCPKLAVEINGELKAPSSAGWLNVLSENWDTITTLVPEDKEHNEKFRKSDLNILIFAQSKNNLGQTTYRFLGVYTFEKSENNNKKIIYKRISPKYDLLSVTAFSKKWLKHFETCEPTDYDRCDFAKDCERLGFKMDSYKSLRNISEEAITNYEVFENIARSTNSVGFLSNAVFSKWRDLTHWSEEHALTDANRKWFIIAFNRLKELGKENII